MKWYNHYDLLVLDVGVGSLLEESLAVSEAVLVRVGLPPLLPAGGDEAELQPTQGQSGQLAANKLISKLSDKLH